MPQKILLATHNQSKIDRFKKYIQIAGVELVSLEDLGQKVVDPAETGQNEWENAQIKARAYFEVAKTPSLAEDSGFYIQGLPKNEQPAKHVQRIAGVADTDSPEVRFSKMTQYYIAIANRFEGRVEAYFKDQFCLYDGVDFLGLEAVRRLTLTNQIYKKDLNFPISSLYEIEGRKYHELNQEQMQKFLEPTIQAATKLIQSFMRE